MFAKGLALSILAAVAVSPAPKTSYEGDAKLLRETLKVLYPSLDRYGQQADVEAQLSVLEALATEDPEPLAFYRGVTNVAVATRDEHVIPFPAEAYRESRREGRVMLPFTVRWIDGQPYFESVADPAYAGLVGSRIVAFDGQDADSVRDTLVATIPADGLSETFALRHLEDFTPTQNENYFDLNYPIWFGARDSYALTLAAADGTQSTIELSALDWPSFSQFYRARLERKPPITFDWLANDVGYLEILSFHDWYYEEHGIDAAARFEQIFDVLNERPGSHLILDLRRNEGGGDISSLLLDFLLERPFREYDAVVTSFVGQPEQVMACDNGSEIALDPSWAEPYGEGLFKLKDEFTHLIVGASERSPREDAYSGEIIVLISGATGSAAAKVAAVLDREDRATFVGEETGGAAAGATAYSTCSLALPHSGIKVDIPLIRFERVMEGDYGRGVLPDIFVDAGRKPPVMGEDAVLQQALDTLAD